MEEDEMLKREIEKKPTKEPERPRGESGDEEEDGLK